MWQPYDPQDESEVMLLPQTVDALFKYVVANYSAMGLQVTSIGPRSLTVELPPEVHDLGSIAIGVELEFGARVDTKMSAVPGAGLTVDITMPHDPIVAPGGDGQLRQRSTAAAIKPARSASSSSSKSEQPTASPVAYRPRRFTCFAWCWFAGMALASLHLVRFLLHNWLN
jgi:hypothetical protein